MVRDLVIIGGGPGGYVAAIRASQMGAKVTLIEQDKIGGVCLNRGCIPTKSFYKNAELLNSTKKLGDFGIEITDYKFNMEKVQSRKKEVVKKIRSGVEQLMKGYKIEVIKGKASFIDTKTLHVELYEEESIEIKAEKIIIATGSSQPDMPEPGMDSPRVITSDEALELDYVPESMVIYGGGVVAVEFASIFASFGTKVTIIKYRPRLIRSLDEEVSRRLAQFMKRLRVGVEFGVKLKEVKETEGGLRIIADTDNGIKEYECETLLVATGRSPNIKGLNLEAANIEYDEKGIKVNEDFETTAKGVYAIGDVIGGQLLAHVASMEGKVCVERIFGLKSCVNYNAVPSCVFSFPEVAVVGITEEQAKAQEIQYIVGKFLFAANGKAVTMNESDGFIKVIAEKDTHKILGIHIIGPHASDLIHEGALAVQQGLTIEQLEETIHSHPTLSETLWEAVMNAKGEAIHSLPTI